MKITAKEPWLMLCTGRFDETLVLFRDVMGLAVVDEGVPSVDTQFARYAQLRLPNGTVLEIVEPAGNHDQVSDGLILSIPVEDLIQAKQELETQGVEFVAPVLCEDGWAWTYFRTPDGSICQLQGTLD